MTQTSHHNIPAEGVDSAITAKVRKLLAKAERTPNAAEADAFSRKAAELIAAHRLDPERLHGSVDDQLGTIEIGLGRGAYVRARLALVGAVAAASGCPVVFRRTETETVAMIAGYRSDLETIEAMYTSLHAQAATRLAAQRRFDAASTRQWRRSFLFGFADEVREMLRESMIAAEQQHHAGGGESLVPALQSRDQRVRDFATSSWGATRRAKPAAQTNLLGYLAGQDAASSADLGRSRVGQRAALGRGS